VEHCLVTSLSVYFKMIQWKEELVRVIVCKAILQAIVDSRVVYV
jgi:hypothetical protein